MPLDQPTTTAWRRPLLVENLEPNPTVFAKQINGDPLRITFKAAGHSGSQQRMPLAIVEDIDFLNALENGVLKIVDGPDDLVRELTFETERAQAQRAEARAEAGKVLDRTQDRDILGVTCIGPAQPGRSGKCGRSLIQTATQKTEVPPLCTEHLHLAPTYHLVESGSKGSEADGASETTAGVVRREWRAATITAPVKESQ